MRPVGDAIHTVGTRLLIVRCHPAHLPRLYSEVIDQKLNSVGKIVDVFGNIESPYATVVCNSDCKIRVGETLFMRPEGRKDARNRKSKNAPVRERSAQETRNAVSKRDRTKE